MRYGNYTFDPEKWLTNRRDEKGLDGELKEQSKACKPIMCVNGVKLDGRSWLFIDFEERRGGESLAESGVCGSYLTRWKRDWR